MMTEFKLNIDLEKQVIKRDINRIESQLSQSSESLHLLRGLKRKVEQARKLWKLSREQNEEFKQKEASEDIRRLRNDFKKYARDAWLNEQNNTKHKAEVEFNS